MNEPERTLSQQLRSEARQVREDFPGVLNEVGEDQRFVLDCEAMMMEAASMEIAAALLDIAEAIREHTQVMRVKK